MSSAPTTSSLRTWPWWRKVLLALGVALVGVTAWARPGGGLHAGWAAGFAVATANVLAAFCLIQGIPRREEDATEDEVRRRGPVVRALGWLAYPLVAAPLNCLALLAAFGTGLVDRAAGSPATWLPFVVLVTVFGVYADLVVLLPGVVRSVGPGLQVLFAAVCGVIDEFPGIGVMVMHRHADGVAMWIIAQPVIFPVLIALMVQWFRTDQARARAEDARLDELDRQAVEQGPQPR